MLRLIHSLSIKDFLRGGFGKRSPVIFTTILPSCEKLESMEFVCVTAVIRSISVSIFFK